MKKSVFSLVVIFWLIFGLFTFESCASDKLVWSTSSGIVTYNRLSGQFEMLWDGTRNEHKFRSDTVYICPDDSSVYVKVR